MTLSLMPVLMGWHLTNSGIIAKYTGIVAKYTGMRRSRATGRRSSRSCRKMLVTYQAPRKKTLKHLKNYFWSIFSYSLDFRVFSTKRRKLLSPKKSNLKFFIRKVGQLLLSVKEQTKISGFHIGIDIGILENFKK
jgi:hypothetical protein